MNTKIKQVVEELIEIKNKSYRYHLNLPEEEITKKYISSLDWLKINHPDFHIEFNIISVSQQGNKEFNI